MVYTEQGIGLRIHSKDKGTLKDFISETANDFCYAYYDIK